MASCSAIFNIKCEHNSWLIIAADSLQDGCITQYRIDTTAAVQNGL